MYALGNEMYAMENVLLLIFTITLLLSEISTKTAKNRNIVVTNNPLCTDIAYNLINKGGNAREVFIAVSLCEGLVHPMDSGIGGGFQAVYYSKNEGKKTALYINSREQSPSNGLFADYELIDGNSIGIPSVLKGYETLYNLERNKLKWSEIIAPVIELCERLYISPRILANFRLLNNHNHLLNYLFNRRLFCNTLRQISKDGPSSSMYRGNGELHKKVMQDLDDTTSFITSNDIINYKVKIMAPATTKFDKYTVYTTQLPGSGYSILFALKMIESIKTLMRKQNVPKSETIVYLLKVLKYTYALQPHLPELDDETINKIINRGGKMIGAEIVDNGMTIQQTIPQKFGDVTLPKMISPLNFGTTNVVIKVGDTSVSATSTINHSFGSGIFSKTMGFYYNNQMRDFSHPNWRRDGKPLRNAPGPNKIPTSSISALIMVDEDGIPVFQIGAAGGSKILSAIVNTLFNYFVLNQTLDDSLQECRFTPKFNYFRNHIKYLHECSFEYNFYDFRQLYRMGVDLEFTEESGYSAVTALSEIRSIPEGAYDKRRGGSGFIN